MKYKILLASLLIFNTSVFPAQACRSGNPKSTSYIRRDNNRCEGETNKNPTSGSLNFISFTTARQFTNLGSRLNLRIPHKSAEIPKLKVLSSDNLSYQMDKLLMTPNFSGFIFNWSTYVLKKLNIRPGSLRALASIQEGSHIVYTPVIIEKASGIYKFVWRYHNRVQAFFEIYDKDKRIYTSNRPKLSNGKKEIIFIWDGRKRPAGQYKIHYLATLYEPEGSMGDSGTIVFTHNPNWLN